MKDYDMRTSAINSGSPQEAPPGLDLGMYGIFPMQYVYSGGILVLRWFGGVRSEGGYVKCLSITCAPQETYWPKPTKRRTFLEFSRNQLHSMVST